jgi:antitoxin component HigA of HigAB toxin-antitoxin module
MKAVKINFVDMPDDYAGLVSMYPPRPLHDQVDERNVEEIVNEMAGHELTSDQEDYLNLMSDLLLKHHAQQRSRRIRKRPVHKRLKYLMEQSEMTPSDLAKLLGSSQPLVSLVLAGKRSLSKQNISKLAARFKLDAGYFLP